MIGVILPARSSGSPPRHTVNRFITQTASFSRGIEPGFGSNYTDQFSVQYGVLGTISPRLSSNFNFRYHSVGLSGLNGENADLYSLSVGAGYQILRRANLGLSYSFRNRSSDQDTGDYTENRVTVTASYQF